MRGVVIDVTLKIIALSGKVWEKMTLVVKMVNIRLEVSIAKVG